MQLSKSEEELMNHLWAHKKAFMKDLIASYDDPKPATTTIATLLKRMSNKGVIGFKNKGNAREYYPLIEKNLIILYSASEIVIKAVSESPSSLAIRSI